MNIIIINLHFIASLLILWDINRYSNSNPKNQDNELQMKVRGIYLSQSSTTLKFCWYNLLKFFAILTVVVDFQQMQFTFSQKSQ